MYTALSEDIIFSKQLQPSLLDCYHSCSPTRAFVSFEFLWPLNIPSLNQIRHILIAQAEWAQTPLRGVSVRRGWCDFRRRDRWFRSERFPVQPSCHTLSTALVYFPAALELSTVRSHDHRTQKLQKCGRIVLLWDNVVIKLNVLNQRYQMDC